MARTLWMHGLLAISAAAAWGCSGNRSSELNRNLGSDEAGVLSDGGEPPYDDEADGGENDATLLDSGASGELDGAEADTGIVQVPHCGDGRIDEGESCDDGTANSNSQADSCRENCLPAHCGDGVVDREEACDDASKNSDDEPNACRTSCDLPRCGDAVRDEGEGCDMGASNSNEQAGACRVDCTLARCGDKVVDPNEGCDDGNTNDQDACRNNCRSASCGDGQVGPGEQCDDGNTTDGDGCQSTCRSPTCGDGVKDANEQCDDGNTANNDGCRTDCTTGCTQASACSNNLFCDGPEVCGTDGRCRPGTPPNLSDNVACTLDGCDEGSDAITHQPNHQQCTPMAASCAAGMRTSYAAACTLSGCTNTPSVSMCSDSPSTCTPLSDGSITLTTFTPACNPQGSDCGPAGASSQSCTPPAPSCDALRVGRVYRASCDASLERCGSEVAETNDCARLDRRTCAPDNTSHSIVTGTCNGGTGRCASSTSTSDCRQSALCTGGRITEFTPRCDAAQGCLGATGQTRTCDASPRTCNPQTLVETTYTPSCAAADRCSATGTPTTRTCPDGAIACLAVGNGWLESREAATCTGNSCGLTPTTRQCPSGTITQCESNAVVQRRQGCSNGIGCTSTVAQTRPCTAICNPTGANSVCQRVCGMGADGPNCLLSTCTACGANQRCSQPTNGGAAFCQNNIVVSPVGGSIGIVNPGTGVVAPGAGF